MIAKNSFDLFKLSLLGVAVLYIFSVGCGSEVWTVAEPQQPKEYKEKYKNPSLNILPGKPGQAPQFPSMKHLAFCEQDTDCGGKFRCVNIFGNGGMCYFKCDPTKAADGEQNPDCIRPENCVEIRQGEGICVDLPSQLFGIGSYKAIVNLKPGEKCLLRYGGCITGYICVDTSKNGSVGVCTEECVPAVDPNSKVQPVCKTKGTVCKRLASGYGACLPK